MQIENHIVYWLALRQIPKLGTIGLRRLWQSQPDVKQLWQETSQSLPESSNYLEFAYNQLKRAEECGIQILTLQDSAYPPQLRLYDDISPVIYTKGDVSLLNLPMVAIVGTRHPSRYGIEITEKLVGQFSALGYVVLSGMAKGIDTIAHQAALKLNGRTTAVWGSGLDCVYPPENRALAHNIEEQGLHLSQFPLGTTAQAFTFPERNKVIAALCSHIIVTEAKAKSGSLLTAQAGLKYGKVVAAVPGSIYSAGSAGPHLLIQSGANLIVDAADIVDTTAQPNSTRATNHSPATSVTVPEQAILDQLLAGPLHIDDLIRQSAKPPSEIVGMLAFLELKGLVKQLAPGEYIMCK